MLLDVLNQLLFCRTIFSKTKREKRLMNINTVSPPTRRAILSQRPVMLLPCGARSGGVHHANEEEG
jgi:hypothetical protein